MTFSSIESIPRRAEEGLPSHDGDVNNEGVVRLQLRRQRQQQQQQRGEGEEKGRLLIRQSKLTRKSVKKKSLLDFTTTTAAPATTTVTTFHI